MGFEGGWVQWDQLEGQWLDSQLIQSMCQRCQLAGFE